MATELKQPTSNKEAFDKLVLLGFRLMRLSSDLKPIKIGWREPSFVFETEYKEGANYGIVGGSEHVIVDGEKGKLILLDFDVKEKIKNEYGESSHITHDNAVIELEDVIEKLKKRSVYLDRTKNRGAHMGLITNENVPQGVNNYQSKNCDKLHVDIRTELGFVVAIAPGYSIEKIPKQFDTVIEDFNGFMDKLGFESVNEITVGGDNTHSGSLSETFKTKCRNMIKKMDVKEFPEFGTDKIGTHDVISFLAMSQRATKVPEEEAVEKIMELLSRISTTKDNRVTEEEIHKMYNKDYEGFGDREDIPFEADEAVRLERESKEAPIEQIERFLNTQVKNDPKIVSQLLRACLSAYTNNPINIVLLAPSSDGKTYATVKVTGVFPECDVITVGRMSPTALIHQHGILIDKNGNPLQEKIDEIDEKIIKSEDKKTKKDLEQQKKILLAGSRNCVDLKNKILLFLDNPTPATYDMLKPIMSHDKKEISYKTTKGDGSLSVKETVIRNWPVFIFCSAKNEDKNEVWEEIKTRVLMTSPESTVTKYKEANRYTALKMSTPSWASGVYHDDEDEKWSKWYVAEFKNKLNDLCRDGGNPVLNPLASRLADIFPSSQGDYMRHFARLCSFISLETMINTDRRPIYELGGNRSVVTTIDDVDQACKILGDISSIPPEKIKFYREVFSPLFERKAAGVTTTLDGAWLTSTELVEEYTQVLGKTTNTKKILENYLKPLTDAGVLESDTNPDMKQQNMYRKNGKLSIQNIAELKSKTIEDSKTVESGVRSCLESLIRSSTKNGISKEKITLNDEPITVEELIDVISGNPSKTEEA